MSSNRGRIQQTPTVPQFVEAARDRQGRTSAQVAFKCFAVVSHGLDHALSPAIVQAHCGSDSRYTVSCAPAVVARPPAARIAPVNNIR